MSPTKNVDFLTHSTRKRIFFFLVESIVNWGGAFKRVDFAIDKVRVVLINIYNISYYIYAKREEEEVRLKTAACLLYIKTWWFHKPMLLYIILCFSMDPKRVKNIRFSMLSDFQITEWFILRTKNRQNI